MQTQTKLQWQVGHHAQKNQTPTNWVPAQVPGAVQLDWAKAHDYEDLAYATNYKQFRWMEDVFWSYRARFSKPELQAGQACFFKSKGIDYQFEIIMNGELVLEQEGMFTPVEVDLTPYLQDENELWVCLFPVPKSVPEPETRVQADRSVKPAVSYSWDWHPRLVPSGIWDETGLEIRERSFLTKTRSSYEFEQGDLQLLKLKVSFDGRFQSGDRLHWVLKDPDGELVEERDLTWHSAEDQEFELQLYDVALWWPHDLGVPNLYQQSLRLLDEQKQDLDEKTWRTGFRKVELVMSEGAWIEPIQFPKSRSVAPIQLRINGLEHFCKGTNWVQPEIFPGIIDANTYKTLLDYCLQLNFNMLRIWGGSIVNKDSFHDYCDEMGIMVWQEFPLSCNLYPDDPHYLKILRQEATSIVERIAQHPSLALWCGGNELFNNWSLMTDQSLPLRLLNSLCLDLDPHTPFIATSPLMGMGHGHYVFFDEPSGEDVFEWMPKRENTAYTEFGMPSPSDVDILEKIIPAAELFPPKPTESWLAHHAFAAWTEHTWLSPEILARYFGASPDLASIVERGQWLQAEGYRCIYETARRQKPYCTMALNWCFNEPWPAAANNSIIQYPDRPKPCLDTISAACRPTLASVAFQQFVIVPGTSLAIDLWILNDAYVDYKAVSVKVSLEWDGKVLDMGTWETRDIVAAQNQQGPTFRIDLPDSTQREDALVKVQVEGYPEWDSTYRLKAGWPSAEESFQAELNF